MPAVLVLLFAMAHGQSGLDPALMSAASTVMPDDMTAAARTDALQAGLWQDDHAALAVAIPRGDEDRFFVFRHLADGGYSAVDATRTVAWAAFGYFGWPREEYERFTLEPVSWRAVDGGGSLLYVRVHAWRQGQRYTVTGHYLVFADGTITNP